MVEMLRDCLDDESETDKKESEKEDFDDEGIFGNFFDWADEVYDQEKPSRFTNQSELLDLLDVEANVSEDLMIIHVCHECELQSSL